MKKYTRFLVIFTLADIIVSITYLILYFGDLLPWETKSSGMWHVGIAIAGVLIASVGAHISAYTRLYEGYVDTTEAYWTFCDEIIYGSTVFTYASAACSASLAVLSCEWFYGDISDLAYFAMLFGISFGSYITAVLLLCSLFQRSITQYLNRSSPELLDDRLFDQ